MHPAPSIILFTTASGAGYGLMALLGLLALVGALPAGGRLPLAASGLALVLVTLGLASSTLHLGHPERAWRAFSQWRSSWLSREGVMAVLTYAVFIPFAVVWAGLGHTGMGLSLLGLLLLAAALLTVVCTAQIYASLKAIPAWHHAWVSPSYLALGLMTGGLWLDALLRLTGNGSAGFSGLILLLVAAALGLKEASWRHVDANPGPTTPGTATGLERLGRVGAFEPPHTGPNYLLREMGFQVARKHASKLRLFARILAFALPLALLLVASAAGEALGQLASVLAALSASGGVVIERWLFFAEAKHVMINYYDRGSGDPLGDAGGVPAGR